MAKTNRLPGCQASTRESLMSLELQYTWPLYPFQGERGAFVSQQQTWISGSHASRP